ncbi:hypothetical protein XENOCAPTIV_010667 [Xenoophorus captivus]|uniref:Uncharacterized protein n=1 Tax=Xenoophorus captivus TaxID=1517983 RepID=A0ABV0Q9F3_9TELE
MVRKQSLSHRFSTEMNWVGSLTVTALLPWLFGHVSSGYFHYFAYVFMGEDQAVQEPRAAAQNLPQIGLFEGYVCGDMSMQSYVHLNFFVHHKFLNFSLLQTFSMKPAHSFVHDTPDPSREPAGKPSSARL